MPNTQLATSLIGAESLVSLENNTVFVKMMNRDYQPTFETVVDGYRTGPTISIRRPPKRTRRNSWTRSATDFTEESLSLTIDQITGDDMNIPEAELALLATDPDSNLKAFTKRYIEPRMSGIAQDLDRLAFAQCYVLSPNAVGTPGVTPNTWDSYAQAMQKLDENLAPEADRYVIIDPAARAQAANALKGLALPEISGDAVSRAKIARLADFDVYMSQVVPRHTVGPLGGTPLVNGGSQTGSSLVTDGWTAAAANRLKRGDIFTIAGVFMVNPITKQVLGSLQQFVVQADVSSDGSGNLTASIYPSIITSGANQTVSASPADNAAITVVGNASTVYAQNLAYHKDAFTIAFARLSSPPQGMGVMSSTNTSKDGFSVRYMRSYDINAPQLVDRLDVYWGTQALYREWSARLWGA